MTNYSINTFPMASFLGQIAPELDQLRRQMDELFETGAGTTHTNSSPSAKTEAPTIPTWRPRAAIQETEESYQIQLQLPGIDADGIEIEARPDGVTVKGDRPAPSSDASPIHSEFRYGAFERNFRLPEEIQQQQVSAAYRDGILTLTLPKRTAAEDYKVKVAIAMNSTTDPATATPADSPVATEAIADTSAETAAEVVTADPDLSKPVW